MILIQSNAAIATIKSLMIILIEHLMWIYKRIIMAREAEIE